MGVEIMWVNDKELIMETNDELYKISIDLDCKNALEFDKLKEESEKVMRRIVKRLKKEKFHNYVAYRLSHKFLTIEFYVFRNLYRGLYPDIYCLENNAHECQPRLLSTGEKICSVCSYYPECMRKGFPIGIAIEVDMKYVGEDMWKIKEAVKKELKKWRREIKEWIEKYDYK